MMGRRVTAHNRTICPECNPNGTEWVDPAHVIDAVNGLSVDDLASLRIEDAIASWAILEDAHRVLAQVRSQLVTEIAERMEDRQVTVPGFGTFIRRKKTDRTKWEKEDLLRLVLDSRTVNEQTGETESQLDAVLAVWNLPAPRTRALRARGIDPDQFCHTEPGGWAIEAIRNNP